MGSVKKALKPITRVVDDIIPNEIKPALPYIAATFGAPYLAGTGLFTQGITNVALRKGLAGALANVGTQVALGKNVNPVSAAVSGLFAGAGPALAGKGKFAEGLGSLVSPDKITGLGLGEAAKVASVPITAGTAEAAYDAAREAEDAYDQYLKEQEAAGNEDIQTRVEFITRYLQNAGFDQDYIDTRLNELGYAANGGLMGTRVGFSNGGDVGTLGDSMQKIKILLMKNEILSAGGGGFGGKDLDDKTDDEIIEIHEDLFGKDKANGGLMATRVGFEQGGSSSIEQQKRENYFDLKRDETMALNEYLQSPISDKDLKSNPPVKKIDMSKRREGKVSMKKNQSTGSFLGDLKKAITAGGASKLTKKVKVMKGDTLGSIAQKHNTTIKMLQALNSGLKSAYGQKTMEFKGGGFEGDSLIVPDPQSFQGGRLKPVRTKKKKNIYEVRQKLIWQK